MSIALKLFDCKSEEVPHQTKRFHHGPAGPSTIMRTPPTMRRGAANTSTVVIVVVAVVLGAMIVVGCLGAGLIGLMLPALGKARESARDVQSSAYLRHIEQAYIGWQQQADVDAAFSFDELVERNLAMPEMLISPHGAAPDGGEDYWLLHPRPEEPTASDRNLIVGYDRAMYATRPRVAVLRGDGSVELLPVEDFEALAAAPPNDELDLNLPARDVQNGSPSGTE